MYGLDTEFSGLISSFFRSVTDFPARTVKKKDPDKEELMRNVKGIAYTINVEYILITGHPPL